MNNIKYERIELYTHKVSDILGLGSIMEDFGDIYNLYFSISLEIDIDMGLEVLEDIAYSLDEYTLTEEERI